MRGSVLRTAGYLVGVLLSVASAPLLIRHLGVVDFGRYITVLSIIAIVGGITDAGLTAVGVREYTVRDQRGRVRLMRNLLGMRLGLTAVGVLAGAAFSAVAGYGEALVVGTLLAGAGLILQVVQSTLGVPLQTGLRVGWLTSAELLKQLLSVVLIVAGVLAGAGVVAFLAIPVPAGLAAVFLVVALVRRTTPLRPAWERDEWLGLLRETLPFAAATAISVAYLRITVVLMSLISTPAQTGYFATSFRVIEVLMGVPNMLVSTLFPVLARAAVDDWARMAYAVQRIFDVGLILGGGGALALCLTADTVIELLAGAESDPSVPVLRIQALGFVATFVAVTCQFALLSQRRHRAILVANACAITVSVLATLALVPVLEAKGAAIAATAAEGLLAASAVVALRATRGGANLSLFVAPKVALAGGLGALPALVLDVPELFSAALGVAVYAASVLALRAVPAEVWLLVRRQPA